MAIAHNRRWVFPFVVIFIAAVIVIFFFILPKSKTKRVNFNPPYSLAVETVKVKKSHYQVIISSYGVVQPKIQTNLVTEVSGRVVEVSEKLRTGAFFKKGDVLLKIDARDYEVELSIAQAAVAESEVAVQQEKAQAEIAKRDWNAKPGSKMGRALALRQPQVAAALAHLKASKARLMAAQLNLERTQVRAPYDGQVITQQVDLGQVVNASMVVADIYATDIMEVRLPIKSRDREYLQLPDAHQQDAQQQDNRRHESPHVVFSSQIGLQNYQWYGHIVRTEAQIDSESRQLYVIAQIKKEETSVMDNKPQLKIGQFVQASIYGKKLNNIFKIPRQAINQNNELAILHESRLNKRVLVPIWSDSEHIIVKEGLQEGEVFSLTPIQNIASGTLIQPLDDIKKDKTFLSKKDNQSSTPGTKIQ